MNTFLPSPDMRRIVADQFRADRQGTARRIPRSRTRRRALLRRSA